MSHRTFLFIFPQIFPRGHHLSENVANLIVSSNGYNEEDAWTNKKDFTYEEESEFPWTSQE